MFTERLLAMIRHFISDKMQTNQKKRPFHQKQLPAFSEKFYKKKCLSWIHIYWTLCAKKYISYWFYRLWFNVKKTFGARTFSFEKEMMLLICRLMNGNLFCWFSQNVCFYHLWIHEFIGNDLISIIYGEFCKFQH